MNVGGRTILTHLGTAFLVVLAFVCSACNRRRDSGPAPVVAVSSSYLECAVRDLLGPEIPMYRLAEPGMCPGHFDIRPSQVKVMRSCRVLARFDFQSSLDRQVEGAGNLSVAQVVVGGGMCEPDAYLSCCRQIAPTLTQAGLLDAAQGQSRLAAIEQRINGTAAAARQTVADAGLLEVPVVSSAHQAAFCRWLGLRVVAVVGGADVASVGAVDEALSLARQAGCRFVIANRPEGTQLAEAMAEHLGAALVVFDNFPDLSQSEPDFDGLLKENARHLLAGARR
jgi:zinc transport system substrate-binding protein